MNLQNACLTILNQLIGLVNHIKDSDFVKPVPSLSNSTVGQHLRHTVEFFLCLEQGCKKGVVNYDKRAHDKLIESDRYIALNALETVKKFITDQPIDQPLKLEVGYDHSHEDFVTINTNYIREVVYNIEHAVHHMAIIKIGVREIADYVALPPDFGIAASTIRYKETSHSI